MSATRTHRAGSHRAPRKTLTGRRRAAFVASGTAVAVLAGGGAAFAYWTTTGSGSGSATARTMAPPTFATATASGTELYPGLTANGTSQGGTLVVKASNPNPFPITVTITGLGAWTDTATCTDPALDITTLASARTFSLAANASSVSQTLPNTLSMGTGATDNCQGKTFNSIQLTTSSTSN